MPTRAVKEHLNVTNAVAAVVALVIGGGAGFAPIVFDDDHFHDGALARIAQVEKHLTDPRPHTGADERLRLLEQGQATTRRAIEDVEGDIEDVDEKIDRIEEGQQDIDRKLDLLIQNSVQP